MPVVDSNAFPKLIFVESASPGTQSSGNQALFVDVADDTLKIIDDAGVISQVGGPRGKLGYVAVTSSQTTTSTTAVDLTSLTLTVTATARSLQITAYCGNLRHSVDGSQTTMEIYDTTGTAVVSDGTITAAAAGTGGPCCVVAVVTPGAGSRSYKARFYADTAGTATFTAAATEPGFLLICEI